MMVSLVLQLCMFLGIAMGKILCYDNCMMKNILKNKKFWKIICILAIIAYTAKNLFIGADTDEGYGIMVGYRLASYFSRFRQVSVSSCIRRSIGQCRRWMRMWQH